MASSPELPAVAADNHQRIGWIGLGSMGLAMALNLQSHLSRVGAPSLRFYNRTEARGESIREIGGVQSTGVQDVIASVDICFISVSDERVVSSIINSVLEIPADQLRGKIVVDTSTIHPDTSSWAQRHLSGKGASFIAAPVFGASPVAMEGKLLFVVAGADEAVKAIEPFVDGVMARKTLYLGTDAAQASLLKTTGNFITGGMMELISEAHVFAEKSGIGNEALESLIEHQYGPLPFATSKRITGGHYIPARDERPWSDLQLAQKDMKLGVDYAEKVGTSLPIADVVIDHYGEARRYGEENKRALDSSSM
ncbi:hypothetical protein MW887_000812 [Aspergillus wentii]|nr:hypothetical protein MW887_000812 [Aspergillus wentii]